MTTPTPEQLAAAYSALRKPDWPETLQAALAYPPTAAALRLGAWRLAQGHDLTAPVLVRRTPVVRPEPPHWAPPPTRHQRGTGIDHKRAASGERDDD